MSDEIAQDEIAEARARNWTIKDVPLETRLRAVQSAQKAGEPVRAWLARAVDLLAEQQGRNAVMPPARANLPVVLGPTEASDWLAELAELVRLAQTLSPPGQDTPLLREARGAVRARLRAFRPTRG